MNTNKIAIAITAPRAIILSILASLGGTLVSTNTSHSQSVVIKDSELKVQSIGVTL